MNRKDKVYFTLKELTKNMITKENIESNILNFNTNYISNITSIERSNVSRILNEFVREGRVIKIQGRPVSFLDKDEMGKLISNIDKNVFNDLDEFLNLRISSGNIKEVNSINDPFSKLIGFSDSLRANINKAKSAILYPPKGLHSLIIGPTGVGKTTFAELMYQYAKYSGTISKDANFVIFNCSEYADNPQLILSQLFGNIKGAFTGADEDKIGLVEKANNGILLLDEIHRLPPEAQEMLFFLMDEGKYRRLGETQRDREANLLIIGATTEDIELNLLETFLRRIPVVIELPSLEARSLEERFQLIEELFLEEVNNIKTSIDVNRDVIIALLFYECRGNIGQLKNDIQLLCARGFLDYKTLGLTNMRLEIKYLPDYIYSGILNQNKKRKELINIINYEEEYFKFSPNNRKKFVKIDEYSLSANLYKKITDRYNYYQKMEYTNEKIKAKLNEDIDDYLNELTKKGYIKENRLFEEQLYEIITPVINNVTKKAIRLAEQELNRHFHNKDIISLAMHFSALRERLLEGQTIEYKGIDKLYLIIQKNTKLLKK